MRTAIAFCLMLVLSLLATPFAAMAAPLDLLTWNGPASSLVSESVSLHATHHQIHRTLENAFQVPFAPESPTSHIGPLGSQVNANQQAQAVAAMNPLVIAEAFAAGTLSFLLSEADQAVDYFVPAPWVKEEADALQNSVPVPIPAAVWLFGGGFTALLGLLRRTRARTDGSAEAEQPAARRDRWAGLVRIQFRAAYQRVLGVRRDDPHGFFVAFDDS